MQPDGIDIGISRTFRLEFRGALKLAERIFPLMIDNAGSGAPIGSLARIVRGWLESAYGETHVQSALDDPTLFPLSIRENASLRAAILEAVA